MCQLWAFPYPSHVFSSNVFLGSLPHVWGFGEDSDRSRHDRFHRQATCVERWRARDRFTSGVMSSVREKDVSVENGCQNIRACVGKWWRASIWKCVSAVQCVTVRCLAAPTFWLVSCCALRRWPLWGSERLQGWGPRRWPTITSCHAVLLIFDQH